MTQDSLDIKQPLSFHLSELRFLLIKVLSALTITSLICFEWSEHIIVILQHPLEETKTAYQLIGTTPADAFIAKLQAAVVGGILFSLPYTFFQFWTFISPALHSNEKRNIIPLLLISIILFMLGVSFCYFAILPIALNFLLSEYPSIKTSAAIKLDEYLSFIIQALLIFGLLFELPIVSFMLARWGLLTYATLKSSIKMSIVVIFVLSAIFTPPDVVSQMLMALPLLLIYFISLIIVKLFGR